MSDLTGIRTLITGAASGIGAATAQEFAGSGAVLHLTDMNADGLAATAAACAELGATPTTGLVDVRNEDQVAESIDAAVANMGGLDALLNVAGVQRWSHSHEHTTDDYRLMMSVNVDGTFFHCRQALPHLIESGGCIVNTASTTSYAGLAYSAVYAATKGAVLQLTKSLAVEYAARGVRVNAVAPGSIATGMTNKIEFPDDIDWKLILRQDSLLGMAEPKVIAGIMAMLASADAGHITGECIRIDGGALA